MELSKENSYTIEDIYALPEGQRAELIDGRIYMMAPPNFIHQKLVMELSSHIHQYIKKRKGDCEVVPAPFAVFLNKDDRNYMEPDISIICDKTKLTDKGCNGAPDWVIEIISPGTARIDYGIKLFKYRSAQVKEYWIINPLNRTANVYDFEYGETTGQYRFDESIPSCIYNDLNITIADLLLPQNI